eukprot:jgi/Mesvir1/7017/Mv09149-RA.1
MAHAITTQVEQQLECHQEAPQCRSLEHVTDIEAQHDDPAPEDTPEAKRAKELPMRQAVNVQGHKVEASRKERFETVVASVKSSANGKVPICCFCHEPSKTRKYVRLVPMTRMVHECNVVLCPECAINMKQFHLTKEFGATTSMKCPMCMIE